MSHGKETPRQKMIGLMYLVLTAMLALNVSMNVLDKYIVINHSLETGVKKMLGDGQTKIKQMKKAISDNGNKDKDKFILSQANDIFDKTSSIIKYIEGLKNNIINSSGGKNRVGKPKDINNNAIVDKVMIKEENANKMQKMVNNHMKYLSGFLPEKSFQPIALDAKDDPFYKGDPNQGDKTFAVLNFDHTPLAAAITTLSQIQSDVVTSSSELIDILSTKIGIDQLKFDVIRPILNAESNTVAAGSSYNAELYLGASSSAVIPKMYVNNKEIHVDSNGIGTVNIKTPSNLKYDKDGFATQNLDIKIDQINPATGEVVSVKKTFQYRVAKPVIDVKAAAVSALYRNAGNELIINVPTLGVDYKPIYKVKGGEVLTDAKNKNKVIIIPKENKVVISVYSADNYIGDLEYNVRNIPRPKINYLADNKIIDERVGISVMTRKFRIKVDPDESFAAFLPKDSRYRIAKWKVMICKGSIALFEKVITDNEECNLGSQNYLLAQADRIVFELSDVRRVNFKNEEESINNKAVIIRNIPITKGLMK